MTDELKSPVVNKDSSVTFNLKNSVAKEVEISADLKFEASSVGQVGAG